MRWLISDTHFLHQNIIEYCNRPENFDEIIQENWNAIVAPDDIVYHLGDFAAGVGKVHDGFYKLQKIGRSLNGTKILIRGNHDWYQDSTYINDFGFSEVHDWLIVGDYFLCHYPLEVNEYAPTLPNLEKGYLDILEANPNCTLIHGHSHLTRFPGKINACVDLNNFTPVAFPEPKEQEEQ